MGLRPTQGDEDLSGADPWADPLVRAGPPGPALRGFIDFSSRPTRASAADQGVRPTGVFNGVTMDPLAHQS
jgi:hypothetical protein